MGYSRYDEEAVSANVTARVASGKPAVASYDHDIKRGAIPAKVHSNLDPKGVLYRESRDSENHPQVVPIVLVLDQTGSMGSVVKQIQSSLKPTMGLLVKKEYVDPHIMIMAIGDAPNGEKAPLQVSQFESDEKIELNLDSIFIEGNGGGQVMESYQNAAYFINAHVKTDHWEKRGEKGYIFFFGDEKNHPFRVYEVKRLIGSSIEDSAEEMSLQQLYKQLCEKWHVFMVIPVKANHGKNGYGSYNEVSSHWKELIGAENVIDLTDENAAGELVAAQIGMIEGTTDIDKIERDITDIHGHGTKTTAIVKAVKDSISRVTSKKASISKTSETALMGSEKVDLGDL